MKMRLGLADFLRRKKFSRWAIGFWWIVLQQTLRSGTPSQRLIVPIFRKGILLAFQGPQLRFQRIDPPLLFLNHALLSEALCVHLLEVVLEMHQLGLDGDQSRGKINGIVHEPEKWKEEVGT